MRDRRHHGTVGVGVGQGLPSEFGIDERRRDRVDPDPVGIPLPGQSPGEHDQSRLGSRVGGALRGADESGRRGDVDHSSGLVALDEPPDDRLCAQIGALQVGVDDGVEVRHVEVERRPHLLHPSVVYQGGHRAKPLLHHRHCVVHRGGVAHVEPGRGHAGAEDRALLADPFEGRLVAPGNRDVPAGTGQVDGDRVTDTARRAGD